jgi:predicted permease
MLQDYKLGLRMLLKYPGLTLAGGLALAIAIGIGAGWYDLSGKLLAPTIPLPEGDRLVLVDTTNTLTNSDEARVLHDFVEWRRELRTIEDLGAFRADARNLIVGNAAPVPIHIAELTAAAFRTARVTPLIGRALLESDEKPGAPGVVMLGYDVWQRSFGGRDDVVGSIVSLGDTPATVIGVMPEGFAYPVNHHAWTALSLRASYEPLEGSAVGVIGRLAPGVTREQADAELRVLGERASAARPATHEHLRPRVMRLGEEPDLRDIAQFALRNLPVLLVLIIACMSVGTLIYARTATREGEIAVRFALGASRPRIIGQLFVETLVLASIAAAAGLIAANQAMTWGIENFDRASGGAPFWFTPGLRLSTILYAGGLAVACAVMLSLLPALKVTGPRLQTHLANRTGGATLRFGRVWTGAMIVQVALTAIGLPVALESALEAMRNVSIRAAFPSREYLAARVDLDRPVEENASAFAARRARTIAELERRIAEEPGVVAVTVADRAPGSVPKGQRAQVETNQNAGRTFDQQFRTSTVGPGFFEAFDRPIVAGRAFHAGDQRTDARTVIVNEAFVREFSREARGGSPVGARFRYRAEVNPDAPASAAADASADNWFEIVGVARDFGLDPDDYGNEVPYVFHAAPVDAIAPLVMSVRMRGNPAALAARLPAFAANVDARLLVRESMPLNEWIRDRDMAFIITVGAQAAVTALVLFLSALSIFSLTSVSVSRRTREIGLRAALGAGPRQVLTGILSRAMILMVSGIAGGGALLLVVVAVNRPTEEIALYAGYLGATSAVMVAACLLACMGPARRALRINPIDALRDA